MINKSASNYLSKRNGTKHPVVFPRARFSFSLVSWPADPTPPADNKLRLGKSTQSINPVAIFP